MLDGNYVKVCREERIREVERSKMFIIPPPHIHFTHWKAIDKAQAAVDAHHVDLISFDDVFYDLCVVQLWTFIQTNG